MITERQVTLLVEERLTGTTLFLVEVDIKQGNRITLCIDGDQGISVTDCQELSRYIESKLDRDAEDYDLTVSSSGADQPLLLPRQYAKHAGRTLEVKLNDGRSLKGKLINTAETGIELESIPSKKEKNVERYAINFNEIAEAKVVLAFKR